MLIIGERINGMFPKVREAIDQRNEDYIIQLAQDQLNSGAHALDISAGPAAGDQKEIMKWLVNTISSKINTTLCIDSPHPEVIEAGIKEAQGKTIINSMKNSPQQKEKILPLAQEYNSMIICLLMTDKGIPHDLNGKIEAGAELIESVIEAGIDTSRIFLDPILLPIANAQKDVADTFELMDQLKMLTSPPPNMIAGLSNLSQKALYRSLLNRTYCVMAMSHGLNAAILDPFDEKLMKAVITAEVLLNHKLYAKSYLKN